MTRSKSKQSSGKAGDRGRAATGDPARRLLVRAAPVALAAGLMIVYLTGLHPGVEAGDAAELQHTAPLGGICHPPGYQIEVTVGRIFCALMPAGAAWSMNFLMAICGTVGCLALYGAVRRIVQATRENTDRGLRPGGPPEPVPISAGLQCGLVMWTIVCAASGRASVQ